MSELVRISPNGTRVRTIPATVQRFSPQRAALHAKKRVAAYARVSTDEEEQLTSYEAQVDYYTRYIQANPDWELVEVYAERCPLSLIQMHPKPILGCIFLREGCIKGASLERRNASHLKHCANCTKDMPHVL